MQAACGVTKKPKEEIFDIDAADVGNELAAVEYVEDIYTFYKEAEVCIDSIFSWFKRHPIRSSKNSLNLSVVRVICK